MSLRLLLGPNRSSRMIPSLHVPANGDFLKNLPDSDYLFFPGVVCNDGSEKMRVTLRGTVPVTIRGNVYHIPIAVHLDHGHPRIAPTCYVEPTPTMEISSHPNVERSGFIKHDCIWRWNESHSSLSNLVSQLCFAFSQRTPVVSRAAQPPSQQYPQSQPVVYRNNLPASGYDLQPQYPYQTQPHAQPQYPVSNRSQSFVQVSVVASDNIEWCAHSPQPYENQVAESVLEILLFSAEFIFFERGHCAALVSPPNTHSMWYTPVSYFRCWYFLKDVLWFLIFDIFYFVFIQTPTTRVQHSPPIQQQRHSSYSTGGSGGSGGSGRQDHATRAFSTGGNGRSGGDTGHRCAISRVFQYDSNSLLMLLIDCVSVAQYCESVIF